MKGQPTHHFFDAEKARLSYFEWGAPDAPPILLLHATGFHARVWDKTVAALPEGYRVIAVELRGHGRSPFSEPIESWKAIAQDVREFVRAIGLRDAIGVGHSMGGYCMTRTAYHEPHAFKRVLLIDPVLSRPDVYEHDRHAEYDGPAMHPIASRRNRWASWEDMRDGFKDRPPYSLWRPEVLDDYCRYGVAEDGDGCRLACAPLVEASVYYFQRHTNIYYLIRQIETPVTVLRAMVRTEAEWRTTNFTKSPTWERLADQFKNGRDVYLPNFTHFIPMQDPDLVARFIADETAQVAPDVQPFEPQGA